MTQISQSTLWQSMCFLVYRDYTQHLLQSLCFRIWQWSHKANCGNLFVSGWDRDHTKHLWPSPCLRIWQRLYKALLAISVFLGVTEFIQVLFDNLWVFVLDTFTQSACCHLCVSEGDRDHTNTYDNLWLWMISISITQTLTTVSGSLWSHRTRLAASVFQILCFRIWMRS